VLTLASYAAITSAVHRWFAYIGRGGLETDAATRTAILLIVIASGPVYTNAIFGQVNAFVLLSAVIFVTMADVAPIGAGVSLAAGTLLKIYPILAAAMVLWNRRAARALLWTAIAGIAIVIVLLPIVPLSAYRSFIEVLSARIDKTALHVTNQSLLGFLERFRVAPELFLNWTGHEAVAVGPLLRGINTWVLVCGLGFLWKRIDTLKHSPVASAAGLMALVAVSAPLGWGHTYVMVLPLVIVQLIHMRDAAPFTAVVIFLCVLALMVPAARHLPIDGLPGWMQNVVYSRYLLATLAMMIIPVRSTFRSTPPRP
jgi:hypothetical protein